MARSSGESGYSRTRSQSAWRCSVPDRSSLPSAEQRLLHGVEGVASGWRGSRTRASSWNASGRGASCPAMQLNSAPSAQIRRDGHPVLGERAGLVHAEHGGRAQGLDRRHPPGEDVLPGDAATRPRARKMVRTTGNSSGRMAMASVMPARSPWSQSPRVRP